MRAWLLLDATASAVFPCWRQRQWIRALSLRYEDKGITEHRPLFTEPIPFFSLGKCISAILGLQGSYNQRSVLCVSCSPSAQRWSIFSPHWITLKNFWWGTASFRDLMPSDCWVLRTGLCSAVLCTASKFVQAQASTDWELQMDNTVHSHTVVKLAFQIGRLPFKGKPASCFGWEKLAHRVKGGWGNDLTTEVSTTEGNT